MEVDLARDIARRLNVKLVLVPAVSSNRIQLLNEGKADVVLATFSVTEERKKQVAFIEPSYYAAMTAVLHKTGSGIGNEASLNGRAICAVAGNYSNKTVAPFVGRNLIESKTLTEAEEKLRAGECEGVNFDDVVLLYQLKSEGDKWQNYDISLLLSVTPAPWGIAVPLTEKDGALAKFLSKTVSEWHRKGTLLRLEKKWVGDNSMALQWLSSKVKAAEARKLKTPNPSSAPAALGGMSR
jgi:polar amino acid transport system substrate-binding protein